LTGSFVSTRKRRTDVLQGCVVRAAHPNIPVKDKILICRFDIMKDPAYDAISKAKRQVQSGNAKGAAETLEDYLETDPHNVRPRLELANIAYYQLGDRKYGDLQMEAIFELEPDNVDALKASLAILSKDKRDRKVADERYLKVIELEPGPEVYNSYARFLRMQFLDFKKAAEYYEKAIALSPDRYEFHQNYAVLLLNDLKDYVRAKHELEEVMRLNPGSASAKKNYDLLMKKKFDTRGNLKRGFFARR